MNGEKAKRECWVRERETSFLSIIVESNSRSVTFQHVIRSCFSGFLVVSQQTKFTTSKQKYNIDSLVCYFLVTLDFQTLLIYYNFCFYVPFISPPHSIVNAFLHKWISLKQFLCAVCFLEFLPLHATLLTPPVLTFLPEIKRSKGYVTSPWYL